MKSTFKNYFWGGA